MNSLQRFISNRLFLVNVRNLTGRLPSAAFATKPLKEKATGEEKNFINKQEQEALKNLLKKIKGEQKDKPEDRQKLSSE